MKHKKKNKQKKKNNKSLYMSLFIVIIMISSAFAVIFYGFAENEQTIRYEDYKFKSTPMGFSTRINKETHYFEVLPQDTFDINISQNVKSLLNNANGIIITSDPNSAYKEDIAISAYNLNNMFNKLNIYSANAFTSEVNNIPVITCLNASQNLPVIKIVENNITNIYAEENCIYINFDTSFNLRRASTKIMYVSLGVLNE
jgi:hypothetical protein